MITVLQRLVVVVALAALAGCMGPGKSGAQALKPWTWFSHQEASSIDRADAKIEAAAEKTDAARSDLLKAAQRETHRASIALAEAPKSRPVEVAADAATNATSALDQALGPLSVDEARALRERVAALLSEIAAVRDAANEAQARDTSALIDAGRKLQAAEAAQFKREVEWNAKYEDLRLAFDRENAKANQLRGMQWAAGGLAILSILAGAGYLYLRITSGGLITTLVGRIESFRQSRGDKDPAVAELLGNLSSGMSRWEKKIVRKVKTTATP